MEKNQEFHDLRSFDIISIILSFLIVCGLVFIVFNINVEQKKRHLAKTNIETLADELILKPVNSSFYSGRNLASETNQGLDPWGSEYISKVVKNSYGQPVYLIILSPGPDQTIETNLEFSNLESQSLIESFRSEGDDIAHIKAYR